MMTEPNPKQTLILWALLGHGGTAMQGALGFKVDPKDRNALERAGMITVTKGKRGALSLEVTDRGWDWSGSHLDAPLPSGSNATKAGTPVLQSWLKRLQAYLDSTGAPLANVLVPSLPASAPEDITSTPAAPQPSAPSYPELRDQVRAAFLKLNGRFGDSVTLSRLRAALPDVGAGIFDEVLSRMHDEDEGTTLMNLSNPREIEPERSSAVRIKGEDMHILWISR